MTIRVQSWRHGFTVTNTFKRQLSIVDQASVVKASTAMGVVNVVNRKHL